MENPEIYRRKLEHLFSNLIYRYRLLDEIRSYTNRYLAAEFNLIELLVTREEDISRIIAALLDPRGGHGQGSVFLEIFLEKLGISTDRDVQEATIRREVTIDGSRRIDILIEFSDGFMLGIENKPWAGDQRNQIEDYADFLERLTGGNYKILFLGGYRKKPSEWSISRDKRLRLEQQGKLVYKSYADLLLSWLKECLKESESDKVRWFIRDFITWIENNFKRIQDDEG